DVARPGLGLARNDLCSSCSISLIRDAGAEPSATFDGDAEAELRNYAGDGVRSTCDATLIWARFANDRDLHNGSFWLRDRVYQDQRAFGCRFCQNISHNLRSYANARRRRVYERSLRCWGEVCSRVLLCFLAHLR